MTAPLNSLATTWWAWIAPLTIQVVVLAALVWLVDLALAKRGWPQVRYALWALVFVKLMLPPSFALPTSIAAPLMTLFGQSAPALTAPGEAAAGDSSTPPAAPPTVAPAIRVEAPAVVAKPSALPASQSPLTWKSVAMLGWAAGIAGFFSCLALRVRRFSRRMARHGGPLPARLENAARKAAGRIGLKRVPRAAVTDAVEGAAAFGVFRPIILLPESCREGLSASAAEHVFLHEFAHVKRGDLIANAAQAVLTLVFWFNPVLWLAARRSRHVRELCCDATVASLLREHTTLYRKTLIEEARRILMPRSTPGLGLLGLFESPSRLRARLEHLAGPVWRRRRLKTAAALAVASLAILVLLPMAPTEAEVPEKHETQDSSRQTAITQATTSPSEATHKVAGTIVGEGGRAVTGATVAVGTTNAVLAIENGKAVNGVASQVESGNDGAFSLEPQAEPYTIAVVAKEGFAVLTEKALKENPQVRLAAWSAIKGTVTSRGKPAADALVGTRSETVAGELPVTFASTTRTDGEGRFALECVRPGVRGVSWSPSRDWASYSVGVVAGAGRTTEVTLGARGREVTGKIVWGEGGSGKNYVKFRWAISRDVPEPKLPDGYDRMSQAERIAWGEKWLETGEGRLYALSMVDCFGICEPDATFTAYDVPVPPRKYRLRVYTIIRRADNPEFWAELTGPTELAFEIPESREGTPEDTPVVLGEIKVGWPPSAQEVTVSGAAAAAAAQKKETVQETAVDESSKADVRKNETVQGTVVDEDGKAVAGVEVIAYEHGDSPGEPLKAMTDSQGKFAFDLPYRQWGTWTFLAKREGFTSFTMVQFGTDEPIPAGTMMLVPTGGKVTGTVVDHLGKALASVRVSLTQLALILPRETAGGDKTSGRSRHWNPGIYLASCPQLREAYSALTDENGRFEITGLPKACRGVLEYARAGLGTVSSRQSETGNLTAGGEQSVTMHPEAKVIGRVVARDAGLEVAGLSMNMGGPSNLSFRTKTGSDGGFSFEGLPGGEWSVGVIPDKEHGEWVQVPLGQMKLEPGKTHEVTIELARPSVAKGRVIDRATRKGVLGAYVNVFSKRTWAAGAQTDKDGKYELKVAPGTYSVGVDVPDPEKPYPAPAMVDVPDIAVEAGKETEVPDIQVTVRKALAAKEKTQKENDLKEFYKVYSLGKNQNVKIIPAPWIKGRFAYYSDQDSPDAAYFKWIDNKLSNWGQSFGGTRASYALETVLGLGGHEVADEQGLLEQRLAADYIWRPEAPREKLAADMEKALNALVKTPLKLTFREVERKTYVARGTFKYSPIPLVASDPWSPTTGIVFYGSKEREDARTGGGGSGNPEKVLKRLGSYIGYEVRSQAQGMPETLNWLDGPRWMDEEGKSPRVLPDGEVALVLKHVSEQTGLTFDEEKGRIQVLFVERAASK